MARRKRGFLEDDDSDSSVAGSDVDDPNEFIDDPDLKEERALFEDPYKRKRRRKDAKEDAIYGVFGEDSEEEGFGGKQRKSATKRTDWTKAPSFVSGNKEGSAPVATEDEDQVMEDAEEIQDDDATGNNLDEDVEMEEDGSEPSKPPSPRFREEESEEPEERTRVGLGIGASRSAFTGFTKGGIGSSRAAPEKEQETRTAKAGLGMASKSEPTAFRKGGIGSSHLSSATASASSSPAPDDFPTAFGSSSKAQRSFVRQDSPSARPAQLSASERTHFSKLSGSFGARMLEKMGWQAGHGLGVSGEGIVTPVESKLRPQKMGIAFKGFKEKTEQSKAEAKRRGDAISDEEEDVGKRRTRGGPGATKAKERSDAWKKPKKAKAKVQHKTYEEILAEADEEAAPPPGIGKIIDATGATPREVSSLAEVSMASWTPTADSTRIPEVRHNIRLIAEACKVDLDGLAKEAKALEERKKWIKNEDERLRHKVKEEADLIERLQQVHLVADDINAQAKEIASMYEASLESFSPLFDKLLGQYASEFERYRLDEIVVAAIAPTFRRMLTQWHPLEDPSAFTPIFRVWRRALKMTMEVTPQNQVNLYGAVSSVPPLVTKPMTPYESLLWNVWLPKIRSCINNDWSPQDPGPAVRLYEAWSSFLPPFIRDNFFDQLVLPKVQKAVADWNPRRDKVSLQTLVFPWLPHVGLRLDDVLGDAKRKLKSLLRGWTVRDGIPKDLGAWKNVFDSSEWDSMMLKYVVPKLGVTLREEFQVNPRNQNMEPLQQVLAWADLLRPSVLSQLLEAEFFPKWLDVLHLWLIQPTASFEEVAQWYSFWKSSFPENVQNLSGVQDGFTRGLQLMNTAIELGPDAPTRLPRPQYGTHTPAPQKPTTPKPKARPSARAQEITFRSLVEEYAAQHNLLFIPTGRAHETSRMPLYRVSQRADGKGGLLVYIQDDAVWAADGDEWRAIPLESMVARALKSS